MSSFDLIHISDLHFGANPALTNSNAFFDETVKIDQSLNRREFLMASRHFNRQGTHDPDIAKKAAKAILKNSTGIDLLIISGDLASTGLRHDLASALSYLERKASVDVRFLTDDGAATLEACQFSTFVIPGNHDRYKNDDGFPGNVCFDDVFARYWPTPAEYVHSNVLRSKSGEDLLGVVGVDFCLTTEELCDRPKWVNRYGQGRVTDIALKSLIQRTSLIRSKYRDIGVIWVVHFPFSFAGCGASSFLKLLDGDLVYEAAIANGVELLLSGHVHEPNTVTRKKVSLCCAGSLTFYHEPNGNYIHLLTVNVDAGRATLSRRRDLCWNDYEEEFVEVVASAPIADFGQIGPRRVPESR